MKKVVKYLVVLGFIFVLILSININTYAETYINRNETESGKVYYSVKEITTSEVWTKNGSPYISQSGSNAGYNIDGGLTVKEGGKLVIEKGVKLYFLNGRGSITVEKGGELIIKGSEDEPVIISNHPSREEGNWATIWFEEGSKGSIKGANISDAGYKSWGHQDWLPNAAIYISNSSPSIENVKITNNIGYGMLIKNSSSTIKNVEVVGSEKNAIQIVSSEKKFPIFSNISASNNLRDGIVLKDKMNFTKDTVISNPSIPYIVGDHMTIKEDVTLDIQSGSIFRFGGWESHEDYYLLLKKGSKLNINGKLSNEVVFTSAYDKDYGGSIINIKEINERTPLFSDGYADWKGIICIEGSEVNIENAVFRYGGDYDYKSSLGWYGGAMINNQGGKVTVNNTLFDSPGIAAPKGNGSFPTSQGIYQNRSSNAITVVKNSIFRNADNAVYLNRDSGSFTINDSRFENIDEYGVYSRNSKKSANAKNNWWGASSGPSGQGSGSGCSVSEYVEFNPFVTESSSVGKITIGDKIEDVLYTDIVTEINGQEVESFNINGSTAIYVRELNKLGYKVNWDGDSRVVTVFNDKENTPKYLVKKLDKQNEGNMKIGAKIDDVLYTDIRTKINNEEVESFNINGSTAIYVSSLRNDNVSVTWNGDKRRVIISNTNNQ